ncbi:FAD-dependent monooxygenase [Streptomyces sp. ST2-7A]|uniref:FAD-dependent monooxygenase n=1 Tax=Streptomyces sp. ST2-7A TaxID=2907214 RepID=UPI001F3C0EC4|nr:FAD-dependent monooxygenase [Streptomyces sp. ST2-7A]MCE7080925.1 FAD-dependent monooxygenase [Streptomyces sp. ST2-7A]
MDRARTAGAATARGTGGRPRVLVVGGGVGGLATAVALRARGIPVKVLERSAGGPGAGSGLTLWPNGVRALEAIGQGPAVLDRSLPGGTGGIRTPSGRFLSRTDIGDLVRDRGPMVAVHRAELTGILRAALPADTVRTGVTVTGVRLDGRGRPVVITDAGEESADVVVGADGVRSTVRGALWPTARGPRYAGYTAWRMVVDEPVDTGAAGETIGRGERFGVVPLRDGRIYAFATARVPEGARAPDGERAELLRRFGGWHDPVPRLLAAAREETILRHDIHDLPALPRYARGRVVLLGDAAHAMTPNLGQGANQALEDAVTLAALLDTRPDPEEATAAYDAERRPRARRVVALSRRAGAVAQWHLPLAAPLRDTVLRLTPPAMALRALAPVLDWTPPPPAPAGAADAGAETDKATGAGTTGTGTGTDGTTGAGGAGGTTGAG